MYTNVLEEIYTFLVENVGLVDLNKNIPKINLIPLSNIDYNDKIRGALVSLAIGDAFGSLWEGQRGTEVEHINLYLKGEKNTAYMKGTWQTKATILFAESLIINQGFNPEDLANRFARQHIVNPDKEMEKFLEKYRELRFAWYQCATPSLATGAVIRGIPAALINYGDFHALNLIGIIQTAITNTDETAIAASILFSTAIAYLLSTPAYSLDHIEKINLFLETICRSIRGIETKVYPIGKNGEITNLYIAMNKTLRGWVENDLSIDEVRERWGNGSNILEVLPLAIYIFIKGSSDYEKTLKECLSIRENDTMVILTLALLGAYLGFNNIPKGYTNKLEAGKELSVLANRLFELSLKNKNNNPYRRMIYKEEIERSQDELDKLLWLGIKCNKEEKYEMSIHYFEELMVKSPDVKKNERIKSHIIEAYEGLGNNCLENEAYEEALRCFKKALIYDLNNHTILCSIAVAYLNMNQLQKAEKYARRAVEITPEYAVGRELLNGIQSLLK